MKIKYKKEIDTLRAEVQQLEEKNRKLESEQDSYNLQEQGSKEKTKELQQFLEAIGQLEATQSSTYIYFCCNEVRTVT
jgi:predicted RNase H-like nuclease (RuvC/YqgF family)